jgi:hypothetical protein
VGRRAGKARRHRLLLLLLAEVERVVVIVVAGRLRGLLRLLAVLGLLLRWAQNAGAQGAALGTRHVSQWAGRPAASGLSARLLLLLRGEVERLLVVVRTRRRGLLSRLSLIAALLIVSLGLLLLRRCRVGARAMSDACRVPCERKANGGRQRARGSDRKSVGRGACGAQVPGGARKPSSSSS